MNTYLKIKNLYFIFIILGCIINYFLYNYNFIFNFLLFFFISSLIFYYFKIINWSKKIFLFFYKSKLEITEIKWPSYDEVIKNIFIVCIFSLLFSLIIWLIDNFILYLFSLINNLYL